MRRFSRWRPSPAMVVACIALFVAMGGAAYAAARIGSGDIVDNSIRSRDVRNQNLRGKDIADGSLGTSEVANNSLRGRDVRGDSLDGSDIDESSLDFVQPLFAVVTDPAGAANAVLSRGRGVMRVSEQINPGTGDDVPEGVDVQFNRELSGCAWTANRNGPAAEMTAAGWAQARLVGDPSQLGGRRTLVVRVRNAAGTIEDDNFHLVVTC